MSLKPHHTDPDKVVFVKPEYLIDGWKKPWIGLTDEERLEIMEDMVNRTIEDHDVLFDVIEAKMKEKNNG